MSDTEILPSSELALEHVPITLAARYCILPKSINDGQLDLYCLNETMVDLETQQTLEFAIGLPIRWLATDRSDLDASLLHYYPAMVALIRNCPVKFRFQCPMTWDQLKPTNNNLVRNCAGCGRDVHFCTNITEANRIGKSGGCVAFAHPEFGTFLGEIELDF